MSKTTSITLAALLGWAILSAVAAQSETPKPPVITKKGTLGLDLCETTPFVFHNKVFRLEWFRNGGILRIMDRDTHREVSRFGAKHRFPCAFVEGDTVYVAGTKETHGWYGDTLTMFTSKDLTNWTERPLFNKPGMGICNTSLCKTGNGYVMSIEQTSPDGFPARFLESKDLATWTLMPEECRHALGRYNAAHCLRWHDGWYYLFYLEAGKPHGYEQYITRSRDLIHWESSPLNPVLAASPEDKLARNPLLTEKDLAEIASNGDSNNSDIDFCEFNGRLIINYCWGTQGGPGHEYVAEAEYDGTQAAFLTGWFPGASAPVKQYLRPLPPAFCKEVLILHHSHVDVGYTHPQSMYWELQKGYLDAALDMLDRTENWPDDVSRPRWTAEVTAPVMRWLQTAPAKDVARLKQHIKAGRFGISGFEYNTTPLCSTESLARQLYPVRALREQLGADIRTVHQHDVTGLPWGAVDLLLDSRIECLVMGINLHLSGTPMPRPAVYRWRGPSGRELLVMNGEHYSMFDQWCNTPSRNLETIQAGLDKYLDHLQGLKYPYDFVYLSATHAPLMYDNSPPNQDLPGIVRQWNEAKRKPRLRLVTPNELLARLKLIPREQIPVVTGDWTDYWNFGAASSAAETCLSRKMTANAATIDLLRTTHKPDSHTGAAIDRLWYDINLYNEHTWGAHNTLDADNPFVVTQWHLKASPAYDGKPLSDFHLRRELHRLAGNPWQSWKTDGVLIVNPTGLDQNYFVPGNWRSTGKEIESHFMGVEREATARPLGQLYGPIPLKPYSWQVIPWAKLAPAPASDAMQTGTNFIESGTYKLTFDSASGKVTSLLDKRQKRELVATNSPWGFFQLVHERPANHERSAFHVRSVEGERYGRTGWKPNWQAARTSYTNNVTCTIEKHLRSATLVIKGAAEGVNKLEQRITLHADSPMIDLSARFLKADIRSPESIYFVFPLNLPANWRAHFDTSGIPTELDAEQIPGSSRDWVTAETFASVHQASFGVTLYCPDAPLVQIGNFNWAKKQDAIPRQANPLLLAWPLNNYWETNFRASQPGIVEFRYSLTSHGQFDPARATLEGQQTLNPPVTHPVLDNAAPRQGQFLEVQGDHIVVTWVKPAEDNQDFIARLINLGDKPASAKVALPGHAIAEAWRCGTLEDNRSKLPLSDGSVTCELQPRQITTIRLVRK